MQGQTHSDLLYRLLYGQLIQDDIPLAQKWIDDDFDFVPAWVRVIAGGNPDLMDSVQEIAQEELAHEILEELEQYRKANQG